MRKMRCAKSDFTYADLPATRKQMFFDCYKEQFSLIFRLGLVCLLLFVPIIVVWLMRDTYLTNALNSLEESTPENITAIYLSANQVFGLFEFLAFTLFFALFSGVAQIVRQLCWGEPIFFRYDFKKGVKENIAGFALVSAVVFAFRYVVNLLLTSNFYYVLMGIVLLIFAPIGIWVLLQKLYYRLRLISAIKNAVLYFINTFPITLLLLVCTVLPLGLTISLMKLLVVKYLVVLLLIVFGAVPMTMAWGLYACHTFDLWLNKKSHTEIYRKGLRPAEIDATPKDEN